MFAATFSDYLKPHIKVDFTKPVIENAVFRLHYQLTVILLVVAMVMVCAREYVGDGIKCIADSVIPAEVIENYCFFMATFTIVRHYNESLLESGFLPHPGVGPILDSDKTLHHTYYQWVPFVLIVQSFCFYMPHYLWKKMEGERIKALMKCLRYASLALTDEDTKIADMDIPSKETLDKRLELIKNNIALRLRISNNWSHWLVGMEVVNLFHVMLQIWIINMFLNGQFINLGPSVLNYNAWNQIADPLETVFPKVTKCTFHKYGASGSIQQHDALCVMALNIIHEKIYTILWFWLLFLFIASVLAVIWRFITFLMYHRSRKFNKLVFSNATKTKFDPYNVIKVLDGCQFADWLFVYYLAKNVQGPIFQKILGRLAEDSARTIRSNNEDIDNAESVPLRSD